MNSPPLQRKVVITNPDGLHMRPSTAFVETALRFQSRITVSYDGKSVDGRAVLDLFLLCAGIGSELTIEAEGPDASEALEALAHVLAISGQVESV